MTLLTEPIVTNNVPIMHHYYFYVNVVNILQHIVSKLFIPRNKSPRLYRGCIEAGGRERNCLGPCPRLLYTSEARPRQQGVVWRWGHRWVEGARPPKGKEKTCIYEIFNSCTPPPFPIRWVYSLVSLESLITSSKHRLRRNMHNAETNSPKTAVSN